eukprot:s207_g37.t1
MAAVRVLTILPWQKLHLRIDAELPTCHHLTLPPNQGCFALTDSTSVVSTALGLSLQRRRTNTASHADAETCTEGLRDSLGSDALDCSCCLMDSFSSRPVKFTGCDGRSSE